MADMFQAQVEAMISIDDLDIDIDDIKDRMREAVVKSVMERVKGTHQYERYVDRLAADLIIKLTEDDDAHQ